MTSSLEGPADTNAARLGPHVESGQDTDPAAGEAWTLSPDGIEFVWRASTAWADAAVADGDEDPAAREAAAHTVAFYTTPPEA